MPIRLILMGLIEQCANREQAIYFLKCQGFSKAASMALFDDFGIQFPYIPLVDDLNPSPERVAYLQELSLCE